MDTKQKIVENWLPRYTGQLLENFGQYILLTNFSNYVELFAKWHSVEITGVDKPMQTATANGILSSIQTALASIGNMGGQIKSAIQAVETFSKADLTSKIGTNLGDPRISMPLTLTNSSTPQVAESGLTSNDSAMDQQAKALAKIKDIEEQISQNKALIRKEQREDAGLFTKLASTAKMYSLPRDLEKANEEYQALVARQNQARPASPPPAATPVTSQQSKQEQNSTTSDQSCILFLNQLVNKSLNTNNDHFKIYK
jgi:hypothetical protein